MQRTLTTTLAKKIGRRATVQGWVHRRRRLSAVSFLIVRDRSGLDVDSFLVGVLGNDDANHPGLQSGKDPAAFGQLTDEFVRDHRWECGRQSTVSTQVIT